MATLQDRIAHIYEYKGEATTIYKCNSKTVTGEAGQVKSQPGEYCVAVITGMLKHRGDLKGLMEFFQDKPEFLEDALATAFFTHNQADKAPIINNDFLVASTDSVIAHAGAAWASLNPGKDLKTELPNILRRSLERQQGGPLPDSVMPQIRAKVTEVLGSLPAITDPKAQLQACYSSPVKGASVQMQNKLQCAFAGEGFVDGLQIPGKVVKKADIPQRGD